MDARAELDILLQRRREVGDVKSSEIVRKIEEALPSIWALVKALIGYVQCGGSGRVVWPPSGCDESERLRHEDRVYTELAEIFGRPPLRDAIQNNYGVIIELKQYVQLEVWLRRHGKKVGSSAYISFPARRAAIISGKLAPYLSSREGVIIGT